MESKNNTTNHPIITLDNCRMWLAQLADMKYQIQKYGEITTERDCVINDIANIEQDLDDAAYCITEVLRVETLSQNYYNITKNNI